MIKQRINIIKIVLILTAFVTNSCTKIVEIDIPQVGQKPTLYSLVGNSTQIRVSIGKSYGIFEYVETDSLPEYVPSDILLTVNNIYSETLVYDGNCCYLADYVPENNDSLKIFAKIKSMNDTIFASTYIPEKILLDTVSLLDSAFIDEEGYLKSQITINFSDIPNIKNYYEVYFRVKCDEGNTNDYIPVYYYNSNSPIIVNENILDYEPQSILFSDNLFDGENVSIPISFDYPCFDYETGEYVASEFKVIVYFLSVSKEYYLYRKTLYKHIFSQNTDIWNWASEPVNMYSNISGGYGVFAGYTLSKYYLQTK